MSVLREPCAPGCDQLAEVAVIFSKLISGLTLHLTGTPATHIFPRWFRVVLYGAFAIGFCTMLLLLVRSPSSTNIEAERKASEAAYLTEAERKAFESGYLLRAHGQFCKNEADKAAAALARQLEVEFRGRLTASDQDLLHGGCPLISGSDVRRRMSVLAAKYELLGETAFDAEGMEGALPAPITLVLSDVASALRNTPAATPLDEFTTKNRDADLLHRQLFGGSGLPFHDEIRAMRKQRVQR